MRDMAPIMPKLKIALLTPADEVMARVREAAEWSDKAANHLPVAANITGIKLAYAGDGNVDPYAGFEARIVPENITLLPKTTTQTTGGNGLNEKLIVAKKGDSVVEHPARSRRRARRHRAPSRACSGLAASMAASRKVRSCAS